MRVRSKSSIYQSWVDNIKNVPRHISSQWKTVNVDPRLVVFAYRYADEQVRCFKNRCGAAPYSALENIFYNKLAEIAVYISTACYGTGNDADEYDNDSIIKYDGFDQSSLTDRILSGNSPISFSYDYKDEQLYSDASVSFDGRKTVICGAIKYMFPLVKRYDRVEHIIAYINADRPKKDQLFPFASIQNGIKVTVLGCARSDSIVVHNDNSLNTIYSNVLSSFYGFNQTVPIHEYVFEGSEKQPMLEYVDSIASMDDDAIAAELKVIQRTLSDRACPVTNSDGDKIDFSALFDPILQKAA